LYIQKYTTKVYFEWDEVKNRANIKKHGLSFESVRPVFTDPLALIQPDQGAHSEDRWQIIGKVNDTIVALVVHTIKDDQNEIYRIISARRVTAYERK
jgi:uncharacterized DUF497 family protein